MTVVFAVLSLYLSGFGVTVLAFYTEDGGTELYFRSVSADSLPIPEEMYEYLTDLTSDPIYALPFS